MGILLLLLLVMAGGSCLAQTTDLALDTVDGQASRKILGSSVVTSVSVIMDNGNGSQAIYADAVGKPMSKPSNAADLASPINLLNPDRYEFYTFDDNGDLVKRLMSLDEIQGIVATGDGDGFNFDTFTSEGYMPEKRVNDIVNNVQNVLKEEMEIHKGPLETKPLFDTPDVSDSWSMILPAIFGNSGEDIKPEKPIMHVTPDTYMVEPSAVTEKSKTTQIFVSTPRSTTARSTTANNPSTKISSSSTQISITDKLNSISSSTLKPALVVTNKMKPQINVEVYSNSKSTTAKPKDQLESEAVQVVEIKPNFELTKDQTRPIFHVSNKRTTKKPKITTTTAKPKISTSSSIPELTNSPLSTLIAALTYPPTSFTTTTTTSTTTTQKPAQMTTKKEESLNSLPTLAELLSKPVPVLLPSTTTTTESTTLAVLNATLALLNNATSEEPITKSSLGDFTTFTIVDQKLPESTTQQEEKTTEDLITLSTEYPKNNVKKEATTLNDYQTSTQLPLEESMNIMDKAAASELLDQLLLTSTNIYEINTELSKKTTTNIVESTTTLPDLTTTTEMEELSTTTEQPTTTTTTVPSLFDSIGQLLSQAVGNVEDTIVNVNHSFKVHEMLNNKKNMTNLQQETATIASSLVDGAVDVTTTENSFADETSLLSDSVGSLLSQVYGDEDFTTIQHVTSTEKLSDYRTTAITNRKTDDTTLSLNTKAAEESTTASGVTDKYEEIDLGDEEKPKNGSSFIEHLINITLITPESIKNLSKLDLSLEKEELIPNATEERVTTAEPIETTTTDYENNTTTDQITTTDLITSTEFETTTDYVTEATTIVPETTTALPITTTGKPSVKNELTTETDVEPSVVITINEKPNNWTLVSTLAPHTTQNSEPSTTSHHPITTIIEPPAPVDLVPKPLQGFGLEDSTSTLDTDIYQFAQLCNELSFGFWKTVTSTISTARSVFVSPFSATSLLAMVFLGARGATSGEMNEILKLDDMVTFNPHLIFKNVTESIRADEPESGLAISAIIRQLYSDKSKGKLLGFYKERVRQFYDGHVEEAGFREIGDVIRRRTNLLVKKYSDGKITEFLKDSSIIARAPLAGVGVNIFQTDCSTASTDGRDGEIHFVVLPSIRQRRLIPIPAVVYRSGFLAGYEPSLDATAVALGTKDQIISTVFVIPGQQGIAAPGDGLARLEKRIVESSFKKGAWSRLLRSLIPRPGLEVQIPRFSHRSIINGTAALKKMGLKDLFDTDKADLRGLNGVANELHLSDVLQINNFATCGEDRIGESHHSEVYPATTAPFAGRSARDLDAEKLPEEPRDYQRSFHDPSHDPSSLTMPLAQRPRQARIPEIPRLRFDRPFLYFVRHNPTGLILHMGRFNPRLLP